MDFSSDEALAQQYEDWTEKTVSLMRRLTDSLGRGAEQDLEIAQEIYNLSHNIKGMGSSFNYPLMTDIGLSLCHCIRVGDMAGTINAKAVDAHVRAFEVVLANQIQGTGGETGARLLERLSALACESGEQ